MDQHDLIWSSNRLNPEVCAAQDFETALTSKKDDILFDDLLYLSHKSLAPIQDALKHWDV